MKWIFNMKLLKEKWWDAFYQRNNRILKPGWAEAVKNKFEKRKPKGCHCSLRAASNRVVHESSRKYGSSNAFTGDLECISKDCRRSYKLVMKRHPDGNAKWVQLEVLGTGEPNHSKEIPFRAQMRGAEKRKNIAKEVEKSRPKVIKRKLLVKKVADPKGKDNIESGNFTNVPTSGALRNLTYEDRKKERLDDNPWLNLSKNAEAINEKYGKGSVFSLSQVPLKVAWATDNQLRHIAEEATSQKVLGGYMDSTGSETKPASFDKDHKGVLTYNVCVKRDEKGNPPIPVSSCIMNDHHEYEIAHYMSRLVERYQKVTKSKKLPFKFFVIDLSRALSNSALKVLNGMSSIIQFLKACVEAKKNNKITCVLLAWCYTHLIGTVKVKIGNLVPRVTYPFSPARGFAKNLIAGLARTSELNDALEMFKLAVIIFASKDFTDLVKKTIASMAIRLGADPNVLDDEEFALLEAEAEEHGDDSEDVTEAGKDAEISSFHETYQDSPFYKSFKKASDEAMKEVEEDQRNYDGGVTNPFYVTKFPTYLLQHILPFYPLWSRYVQCIILPNKENPLSNSPSEVMHKLDKEESLGARTFQEVTKVMVDLVEGAEERLLEVQYPTDFTKYRKRKRNDEDDGIPTNKAETEKWRRRRRKRVPGGLYSTFGTASYAKKLLGKAKRAAAKMAKQRPAQHSRKGRKKSMVEFQVQPQLDLSGEMPVQTEMDPDSNSCNDLRLKVSEVYKKPITEVCRIVQIAPISSEEVSFVVHNITQDVTRTGQHYETPAPSVSLEPPIVQVAPISSEEVSFVVHNITQDVTRTGQHYETPAPSVSLEPPIVHGAPEPSEEVEVCSENVRNEDVPEPSEEVEVYSENVQNEDVAEPSEEIEVCRRNAQNMSPPDAEDLSSVHMSSPSHTEYLQNGRTAKFPSRIPPDFPTIPPKFRGDVFGHTVYDTDLKSILPKKELCDSVIDSFFALLKHEAHGNEAEVLTLPSHILESISMGLEIHSSLYEPNVIYKDLWLVPCHIQRNHWILFAVIMRRKIILILDPLSKSESLDSETVGHLKKLMYLLSKAYLGVCDSPISWKEWAFYSPSDVAVQKNSFDCGVFVCVWGYAVCSRSKLLLSKISSDDLRKWLATVIFTNATRLEDRTFVPSRKEHVDEQYDMHDRLRDTGSLHFEKPWENVPVPKIHRWTPDGRPTTTLLDSFLNELFLASETKCGAPHSCKLPRASDVDMYLCELCRDWFHLACVEDTGGANMDGKDYLCPLHKPNSCAAEGKRERRKPSKFLC